MLKSGPQMDRASKSPLFKFIRYKYVCCGQSPHRPIASVAHLQEKSSQTGCLRWRPSDGQVREETRQQWKIRGSVGERERKSSRAKRRFRELEEACSKLTKTVALPHFIVEYDMVPPLMVQTTGELSNYRRLSNQRGLSGH